MIAIYAPGGGRGHLARARAIAARVRGARIYGDGDVPPGGDALIVDTFADGRGGEITDAVRARFRTRILVRRYTRAADAPRGYDRVWLPYARAACEWDGAVRGTYVGPLVRALRFADEPAVEVAVLGDAARLPWQVAWPAGTRFVPAWDAAIPRAARYVVVGAGHNTMYELRALGVRFAAYPLDRRFDDQHRRAARLGVGVWTPDALARFLA